MKSASTGETNHIDKFAPINVVLLHETIEHVLPAGEQLGKSRMVILEGILDHEESSSNT